MSDVRDHNHATVVTAFARAGASVIDLSKIGRFVPDLLVGYAGSERLVEIKSEADDRPARERMRPSSRCGTCGKTYRAHRLGKGGTRDLKTGERTACEKFAVKMVASAKTGGKVSKGQDAFAREWPGSPVAVVRTADDVARLLVAMADAGPTRAHAR